MPYPERFTEVAQRVIAEAQNAARKLKHNYLGTEHILIGLLVVTEGLASRVLADFDLTVELVEQQIVRIVGEGENTTDEERVFTPRTKKILELALRESLSLGHSYIGTEHILLGMVRENEGVAARILLEFDAGPEAIRDGVIVKLGGVGRPVTERGSDPSLPGLSEIVRIANDAALEVGSPSVLPEHLLIALTRDRGLATQVLETCNVRTRQVQQLLYRDGFQRSNSAIELPQDEATRHILQRAADEAADLEDDEVTAEHVLLALMRDPDERVDAVFAGRSTTCDEVMIELLRSKYRRRAARS